MELGPDTRAITLMQPMAGCIAEGWKRIENRPVQPARCVLGRVVLIHAGLKWNQGHADWITNTIGIPSEDLAHIGATYGHIIAAVTVAGVVDGRGERGATRAVEAIRKRDGYQLGQEHWYMGPIGIVLTGVLKLRRPVAASGNQAWWRPTPEVLARVQQQLR